MIVKKIIYTMNFNCIKLVSLAKTLLLIEDNEVVVK